MKQPGESWIVPQPLPNDTVPLQKPHNVLLDNIEAELDVLIANLPREESPGAQEGKLEPALRELSRVLSSQDCLSLYDCASRTFTNCLRQMRKIHGRDQQL